MSKEIKINGKELLSPQEVAEFLGISKRKVYYMISNAEFDCLNAGTGIRVLAASVRNWVDERMLDFDRKKDWIG